MPSLNPVFQPSDELINLIEAAQETLSEKELEGLREQALVTGRPVETDDLRENIRENIIGFFTCLVRREEHGGVSTLQLSQDGILSSGISLQLADHLCLLNETTITSPPFSKEVKEAILDRKIDDNDVAQICAVPSIAAIMKRIHDDLVTFATPSPQKYLWHGTLAVRDGNLFLDIDSEAAAIDELIFKDLHWKETP